MNIKIRAHQGFTLLELMMVAAIIAILAKVALPSYQNYVKKARIADATSALADYRVKYENFFLDNKAYPTGAAANVCLATTNSAPALFTISCASTATTYTITAAGNGQMSLFTYSINQANVKQSATEWGNSTTCWVKGSGGSC